MRKISIIAAVDKRGLIGKGNVLPWNFKEDLLYFKKRTMNKTVIMGERTYRSIGKPLPGRDIIVLTQEENRRDKGVRFANSVEQALSMSGSGEVMIAGGRSVYEQFLDLADLMYLTVIDEEFEGDVYFPRFNEDDFEVVEERKGEDPLITYKVLKRKDLLT